MHRLFPVPLKRAATDVPLQRLSAGDEARKRTNHLRGLQVSGAARSHSPRRLAPVPLGPRRAGLLRLAADEDGGLRGGGVRGKGRRHQAGTTGGILWAGLPGVRFAATPNRAQPAAALF